MTTPRVTVPVEDLAGKLKAIRDKFLMPTPDKDFTDYAVMTRCIDALSAAPAPEGVAVRYRHKKRGTEYTLIGVGRAQGELQDDDPVVLYRGDDGGLWVRHQVEFCDGRFEQVSALVTREEAPAPCKSCNGSGMDAGSRFNRCPDCCEEAPAEAGELIDHLEAYRPHLADEGAGSIYVSMTLPQLDDILSALRAQPPAREDALPVGTMMPEAIENLKAGGSSVIRPPHHGGVALYTHPAPDALRVAVGALEEIADTDPDEGASWFHDRANQALAALQAERGTK